MTQTNRLMNRSEGDPRYQWDLRRIFPDTEAWESAFAACGDFLPRLAALQGKLGESGERLLDYYRLSEEIHLKLGQVYEYAFLRCDEDTGVSAHQEMRERARDLAVRVSTASAFATPELIAVPDETLERFFAETPELNLYRNALAETRRRRAHVLTDREEALLSAAGTMGAAPSAVFELLSGADLKFPEAEDARGVAHPVTNGGFATLMQNPDRVLRDHAFHGFFRVWLGMKNTAAALLNAQHKQLKFFADARRYGSSREASLDGSNVPAAVYDNLIAAVHENLPTLHRYMALRKRVMGLDELHMYDIYASLVPAAETVIPYEEAQKTVKEALSVLGEDYVAVLQQAFDEGWIDVYENVGKRAGAYSSDVPGVHPYILLNQKDTLKSCFTLAHELGHAMHSYLSDLHQPAVYANYSIFVAEVASTVNEALLMQHLLKQTTDRSRRAYLINYFLEQFRTIIYRQTMFAEFERNCGELVAGGGSLTAERLCADYLELNRRYYGPSTTVDEEISVEWARIPHFYYDYYVFQYATGFSAAMAISRRILTEGENAVRDYKRFLSSGCSMPPIELLKLAGADMTTAQPVNAALAQFGELIDEMEALLS